MAEFEFAVGGAPVTVNARFRGKAAHRNYSLWQDKIEAAARSLWIPGARPIASDVYMRVTHYYTSEPAPDVDNLLKPILDALVGVVYVDDAQVCELTVRRVDLSFQRAVGGVSAILASALGAHD